MRLSPIARFVLLFLAQVALWNYFNFTPYVFVVFLPAMLLCLPVAHSSVRVMLLSFVLGLAADFLVGGQLGLTSLALVPVAVFRRRIIRSVFGQEYFSRGENLSFQRLGWQKFLLAILLLTAIYLLVFVWADSAGMYSPGFLLLKFGCSLAASTLLSLPIAYMMLEDPAARWK